jgi:glycerol-3-phosphate O-acyltransferase
MTAIARVVPILPVALVSRIFLEDTQRQLDIYAIEARYNRLITKLQARGAPVFEIARSTRAHLIVEAVNTLHRRHLIISSGNGYQAAAAEEKLLRYYANSIGHWWGQSQTIAHRPDPEETTRI